MSFPPPLPTGVPPAVPPPPGVPAKELDTSVPPPNFYGYQAIQQPTPGISPHGHYYSQPPPSVSGNVTKDAAQGYNYPYNIPPPTHMSTETTAPVDANGYSYYSYSPYGYQNYEYTTGYDYYNNFEKYNYAKPYYGVPPPSGSGNGNGNENFNRFRPPSKFYPRDVPSRGAYNKVVYTPKSYVEHNKEEKKYPDAGVAKQRHPYQRDREKSREKLSKPETERDRLLKSWRANYCESHEDIANKLVAFLESAEQAPDVWVRSSPADLFYKRNSKDLKEIEARPRLEALCKLFDEDLIQRAAKVRASLPSYEPPPRKPRRRLCRHKTEACSSSDSESSEDEFKIEQDYCMEELSRKLQHPHRIHPDLWHNDSGEMNDGPLCRCSAKSKRIGIRHGIYPGEIIYPKCQPFTNNAGKLHHYRITISPPTNFLTKTPTIIKHDEHEFIFEGFSLFTHQPLGDLPTCKVIRFNIEYTILYVEEDMPENFVIQELELFNNFLFYELLELIDFNLYPNGKTAESEDTCPAFHFMPRFVRDLPDNGKEVLAMCEVLKYLIDGAKPLVDKETLKCLNEIEQSEWQDYVDYIKGMLVTKPGYKPCSVRVDQLDRNASDLPECVDSEEGITHPVIVHFGIRPPQLSYAGNPEYQKAWREYVKFRHLLANMSKPSFKDKRKLEEKETRLQEMRTQGRMKRNITVAVSSKGYFRTGIMCDIVQHAMLIPVLAGHLRFHRSLTFLEENLDYKFKNRYLLQLALTHPSYKENYGTNPDHARNSLTNCGIRQPEYGDRKIHYMNTRKRGINTLINIMSRFGKEYETMSNITHNERLEFLGDAVVEFLSSIHLFFMFPDLEEGGLATYRAAIVQNQHLALLAKKLKLEEFMLYAHGSDLCHELELRHAMANCFEALMGALLLDGGINTADKVFMNALFLEDSTLKLIWENVPEHPLQEQEPLGDRDCIDKYPILQQLVEFENSVGIQFKHIRLLARAFTDRSIGFTHLTLGSNQRLEFLGDTVLQLICSEYLYRHFPEHHEGHLSLLRSSLVNNRTQAVVCDDLGMTKYAVYSNPKAELKTKDRADLLEAFLGALYVDKGLLYCEQFCHVCLFPRLQMFIMNQDWNDPKSKLQQCCLTLRTMDGGEPDIPIYKVIESSGPTNTRVYTVAVYFRSKRLATATGSSIQQAEMNAAKQALEDSRNLFPQLDHQKRVIAKSIKKQKGIDINTETEDQTKSDKTKKSLHGIEDESHLPKQYRNREDISSDELPEDEHDRNGSKNKKSPIRRRISSSSQQNSSSSSSSESNNHSRPIEEPSKLKKLKRKRKRKRNYSYKSNSSTNSNSFSTYGLGKKPLDLPNIKTKTRKISFTSTNTNVIITTTTTSLPTSHQLCEDVSSDECFEPTPPTAPALSDTISKKKETESVLNPLDDNIDIQNIPKSLLDDIDNLVEDVSSTSDIESGELSD